MLRNTYRPMFLVFTSIFSGCMASTIEKTDSRATLIEMRDERVRFVLNCLNKNSDEGDFRRCTKLAFEKTPKAEIVSGLGILNDCVSELGIDLGSSTIERYIPSPEEEKKIQDCIDEEGKYSIYRVDWRGRPLDYLRWYQIHKSN